MGKLDLSGVRIYTNTKSDIVDAMDLIGKKVYFSDFKNFSQYIEAKLTRVICAGNEDYPFWCKGSLNSCGYKYIILAEDAESVEEKKLRPFKDLHEFAVVTGCNIGDVITILRNDNKFEETCIYNGYRIMMDMDEPVEFIELGTDKYTFDELLQYFKYQKCYGGNWKPFGVEE